jgi:hypothetical protein
MPGLGVAGSLVVGALATWRVSRLIVHEDGPANLVVRVRRAVDATPLAGVMDCFACTSVWVGWGVAAALFGGRLPVRDVAVAGLALSGAAVLAERTLEAVFADALMAEPEVDSPLVTVMDD